MISLHDPYFEAIQRRATFDAGALSLHESLAQVVGYYAASRAKKLA
jgi:hypothetical protein